MLSYDFLLVLAVILLSTKLFGLATRRVSIPSVVGALIAGIVLGPSVLNAVTETEFIIKLAELGVIMLMFLAGLDTDIHELKKTGLAALVIATCGVVVPLVGGYIVYACFYPTATSQQVLEAVFMGVVLTATSVSITVETLRELGKLTGKMGTAILGAAVIDDIIGIIILTIAISFKDPTVQPIQVVGKVLGFFIFVGVVGAAAYFLFKAIHKRVGEKRRVAIYAFAFCLIMSYCSEQFFGIADITGAYFAGIILCSIGAREYIAKKVNVTAYMICSPVFFAAIGIKTSFRGLTSTILVFSLALLVVAILSKIVGCGLGAKLCKFNSRDSLCIGVGMVSRGEVALIVAQKGVNAGLVKQELFPAIILVVIVTTLLTPILLKFAIPKNKKNIPEEGKIELPIACEAGAIED